MHALKYNLQSVLCLAISFLSIDEPGPEERVPETMNALSLLVCSRAHQMGSSILLIIERSVMCIRSLSRSAGTSVWNKRLKRASPLQYAL